MIGLLVVASCSIEQAVPLPYCQGNGSGLIAAQSVPGADLVPCFDSLPEGWETESVKIDQSGTVIRFDSDRAGDGAAVFRFAAECDPGPADSTPSEYGGAERFDEIEQIDPAFRARRYYTFEGGCVWWEFEFAEDASARLSSALGSHLVLLSRDSINDNISETFIDAEL
ncbi:MAG: hypothetical protein GY925_14740 [Actinomycetia bacterium]|nr:hypothetical protein [Actinomycetes bacterium]